MHRFFKSTLILALLATLAFACGGSLPGSDKVPGGGLPSTGGGKVDPSACGGMNMNAATKNLRAFL